MDESTTPMAWKQNDLDAYIRTLEKENRATREALESIGECESTELADDLANYANEVLASLTIK